MKRILRNVLLATLILLCTANLVYADQRYTVTNTIYGAVVGTTYGDYLPAFHVKEIHYRTETSYNTPYLKAELEVYNSRGIHVAYFANEKAEGTNTTYVGYYWERESNVSTVEYYGHGVHTASANGKTWTCATGCEV